MSSTPSTSRPTSCSSSSARLELENVKLQNLNKAILLGDILPKFDSLKEKLSAETWPQGFLHVNKGKSVQFYYIVNDDTSEPPQLLAFVIITKELASRAYTRSSFTTLHLQTHFTIEISHKSFTASKRSCFVQVIIFDKNTTPSAKSQANLVLIAAAILEKYVEEERNMEYYDEFNFRLLSFIINQLKLLYS